MSTRELRALGIIINNSDRNTTNQNIELTIMAIRTTALQVNLFYNVIDINTAEGKKLHQKAT